MPRKASPGPPDPIDPQYQDVVDPHMRAHIYSLCTALGGPSITDPSRYELGDEALPVLKDIRQWLRLYDRALNRFDVARCLSEAELVQKDLLEIIGGWREDEPVERRGKWRVILACIELMAPLTWPLDKQSEQMTLNHHRHIPVLEHAQRRYKKAILQHPTRRILCNIIRTTLPCIAVSSQDRDERDDAIINLALHLLRNIVQIEHRSPSEFDTGEEINRSATIAAFADQNVLDFLLMLASGVGDEFRNGQDVVLMGILFHLVKGVEPEVLFRGEKEDREKMGRDLTRILKMEDEMKRANSKAATRHNRFGTTVWLEREDKTRSFVSGQDALLAKTAGLENIDKSKKFKKRVAPDIKGVRKWTDIGTRITLEPKARDTLRDFVEKFIDAGFNPLIHSLRRAIEHDNDKIDEEALKQFFYIIGWLLRTERVRRQAAIKNRTKGAPVEESELFTGIASVLNQEFLVLLQMRMKEFFDNKMWQALQASMQCITQIMYTIQDMGTSRIQEDQDIAENLQMRLFYDEPMLIIMVDILKSYSRQPMAWLDNCTEMVHVHLRLLERFVQQHEHVYIRTKRRRKKKAAQPTNPGDGAQNPDAPATTAETDNNDADENQGHSSGEENSRQVTQDRAFDFDRFEAKYMNPTCINTFIAFLKMYQELNTNQLMRIIKFLHRVAEKKKMDILLTRIDIVNLLYNIMQGPERLPKSHGAYKAMDEFVRHFFRKMFKKLQKTPALYVELLFTKLPGSLHYLQNGEPAPIIPKRIREAATLEVKPGLSRDEQIGIVVAVLLNSDRISYLTWLKAAFQQAYDERRSFEDEANARHTLELLERAQLVEENPDEAAALPPIPEHPVLDPPAFVLSSERDDVKTALYKDGQLRLLLTLLGAQKRDINAAKLSQWIIPETTPPVTILSNLRTLQTHMDAPPEFDDGVTPESLLRRKPTSSTAAKRRLQSAGGGMAMSSDSEPNDSDNDFLLGDDPRQRIPTRPLSDPNHKPKKKRPSRSRRNDDDRTEEEKKEQRRQRRLKEKEKRLKIKSAMWIEEEDEADDDERFWEKEEEMRRQNEERFRESLRMREWAVEKAVAEREGREAVGMGMGSAGESEESDDEEDEDRSEDEVMVDGSDEEEYADGDSDVEMLDVLPRVVEQRANKKRPAEVVDDDDDDDDDVVVASKGRPRKRAVLDSDDEE